MIRVGLAVVAGKIELVDPETGEAVARWTHEEGLEVAAELLALASPDTAAHVRAGPLGIGAEFVTLLRRILAR